MYKSNYIVMTRNSMTYQLNWFPIFNAENFDDALVKAKESLKEEPHIMEFMVGLYPASNEKRKPWIEPFMPRPEDF